MKKPIDRQQVERLSNLSKIPRPIAAEFPANPFLLSCVSHRYSVSSSPTPSTAKNPNPVLLLRVAQWNSQPSAVVLSSVLSGFADFSSLCFSALRFSVMSTPEQRVGCTAVDNRSEMGVVRPVEAIGSIDHPSYSDNTFQLSKTAYSLFTPNLAVICCYPNPFFLTQYLPNLTKDKKASVSVGKSATPSPAQVKSKKRKASSAPSRPVQSSRERKYSTRSSSRLVSNFSNTDDDPVDLVSSPLGLGDDEDSSGDEDAGNPQGSPTTEELIDDYSLEERDTGLAPESDPPCIPLDLSSRRARFQQLERSAINVDFGFSDAGTSTSSQLIRSVPSVESLSFAKAAVRNFLELGLHQLGETQRLAMISAVSILWVAPEFSSDSSLLENVATIFSDSDAAQAKSTSLMAKVEDFHHKRRKAEVMEQENSSVRAQIKNLTTEYDTNEDEVKRLEEKILEHRAKMASLMDEAESLENKLSNRRDTQIVVDEVVSLKEDYGKWVREIQDSDEKQGECLLKWEQLRRLFC
ncbi:disease resistance protein [Dorcoceras hygrometricum]|uniref:Disease resistance protein n=1 Tax=Dorcoceras hygrometricum TaxID=472368 RepID=A0A2Z7AZJ9_9LAMI|nr:disease resistance protein [Dorcoceras hygrometricum]